MIPNDDIVPVRRRDSTLPTSLCAILDKALERKARDRYQTAGEMFAVMKNAQT